MGSSPAIQSTQEAPGICTESAASLGLEKVWHRKMHLYGIGSILEKPPHEVGWYAHPEWKLNGTDAWRNFGTMPSLGPDSIVTSSLLWSQKKKSLLSM